ncbi:MAG TPA: hypothetical protein DCZ63_00340 [Geobacter sp.]|nr:hypothetical protein [Geobacter sp.]
MEGFAGDACYFRRPSAVPDSSIHRRFYQFRPPAFTPSRQSDRRNMLASDPGRMIYQEKLIYKNQDV